MLYSALVGNPVKQSVSPALYQLFAEQAACEYMHLKILIEDAQALAKAIQACETLGFCGLNITIPYKQTIISHLDELDAESRAIGAVNTIVFKDGKRYGYNTDCYGALHSIATQLRPITSTDKVLILGTGGAARALIYGAARYTQQLEVFGRNASALEILVRDLDAAGVKASCRLWQDESMLQSLREADFLINTTPLGMMPHTERDPIGTANWNYLAGSRSLSTLHVFDAIYNPYLTLMATHAQERGAKVCSGLWMLIYQGAKAFTLWTGHEVTEPMCQKAHAFLKKQLLQK